MRGKRRAIVARRASGVTAVAIAAVLAAAAGAQAAAGPWTNPSLGPDRRAALVLSEMTLQEKAELMSNDTGSPWAYYNAPIERLGIPALKMLDAGAGLRLGGVTLPDTGNRATAMPSPLALAAAFDPALAARYGRTVAEEVRQVGGNVLLGPNGDIVRQPWWGRANETEGEDPFLAGQVVGPYVRAVQDEGVIADLKHYNLYQQEVNRCCGQNVIASEREVQEIFTPPWEAAVKAGLGSTMCSFNRYQGEYACQNRELLTDILREQLGFKGFVLSDFGAVHDTVASLRNGLDMETGNRELYTPQTILAAVSSGQVPESTIDEHARRILRTMFAFGLFDGTYEPSALAVQAHSEVARDVAESGMVLLKDDDAVLPLSGRSTASIAVIGSEADRAVAQGGASHVTPTNEVSLLDGLRERAPAGTDVEWAPGTDRVSGTSMLPGAAAVPSSVLSPGGGSTESGFRAEYFTNPDLAGAPSTTRTEPGVRFEQGFIGGSPAFASLYGSALTPTPDDARSVRYTGTLTAPAAGQYRFTLTGTGDAQMFVDGDLAVDMTGQDGMRSVASEPRQLDAGQAIDVVVEYRATRPLVPGLEPGSLQLGWTHPSNALSPDIRDAVDLARDADVAVVLVSTFESEQRDRASLTLPNDQDQLVEAVSAVNPRTVVVLAAGGPVTMPWLRRVPAVLDAFYGGQEQGNALAGILFGDVNPSGKLPLTFPRDESQPQQIGLQRPWDTTGSLDLPFREGVLVGYRGYDAEGLDPLFPFGHGLSYTSFDYDDLVVRARRGAVEVSFTVTNSGQRTGAEAAQVYVGRLPTGQVTPPHQLAGFSKPRLAPGATRRVTVTLNRRAFSTYSESDGRWVTPSGRVPIAVGSSSRDLRLQGSVAIRSGTFGSAAARRAAAEVAR
jgi:beta-glucosidase